MSVRKIVFALAVSLLLPASAGAGAMAATPTGIEVTRATLPNGLQIVVLRDRLAPVVTTWLNLETGSDDEPYTGLAHAQPRTISISHSSSTAVAFTASSTRRAIGARSAARSNKR
jgi:hypothetical protein